MRATSAGDRRRALPQQPDDLPLALPTMAEQPAHQPLRAVDQVAMPRIIDAVVTPHQPLQAGHIRGHVAIGRRGRRWWTSP